MASTDKKIRTLRSVYAAIGEAISIIQDQNDLEAVRKRLTQKVQEQNQIIDDLIIKIQAYETMTKKRVDICHKCLGAGAFFVNGEVEECNDCDGAGWTEIKLV